MSGYIVKFCDQRLPGANGGCSVKFQVAVVFFDHEVFQNAHHLKQVWSERSQSKYGLTHLAPLGEKKYSVALLVPNFQQLLDHYHLAGMLPVSILLLFRKIGIVLL